MSELRDPVNAFLADRAVRSEWHGGTVWFFAEFDDRGVPTFLALREGDDEPDEVERDEVEANVASDSTTCESVPVKESPFAEE